MIHPWFSKIFYPMNWLIIKLGKKNKQDYVTWKRRYNEANLEFPGGINDWYAFTFLLAFIYAPIIVLLILFDLETGIFEEKWKLYTLFIIIAAITYYWIYYKNIEWLKERINKVSKKYYLK